MNEQLQSDFDKIVKTSKVSEKEISLKKGFLNKFIENGFPNRKLENWKFSDLSQIIHNNIGHLGYFNDYSSSNKIDTSTFIDGLEHNGAAGQYSELMVKQVGSSRSYSFAKAPQNENPNELSFFIRNVPKGRFSRWLFSKDPTGQKLELKTPFGSFYYRDAKGPMVCIAGGSGMSAVKAILEQAAIDQVERDAIYLFGARTQDDIYSKAELEDIQKKWNPNFKFEFVYVLNMEPEDSDWTGARGMVTDFLKSDYIEKGKLDMKECQGYLCGPPPMIDAAIKEFTAEGMSNEEIFFDKFLDSGSK